MKKYSFFPNPVAACSLMRRMNQLARDYATKRSAFGQKLEKHAAHVQVLARLDVESRAAMLLSLQVARLLGKVELNQASKVISFSPFLYFCIFC